MTTETFQHTGTSLFYGGQIGVKDERKKKHGWKDLRSGIDTFLSAHGLECSDDLVRKVGNFTLSLASVRPSVPLEGKRYSDLSIKQRSLFKSNKYNEYEGTGMGEFLANWLSKSPNVCFVFSKRTVKLSKISLVEPGVVAKTVTRLCHERPDPVISYEKLAMAVPRFLKDMQGRMKYLSVGEDFQFENAGEVGSGLWVRTAPINTLLSILDHRDVHVHRGKDFLVIYNRWFGLYCGGE